jgi:8-oxo-dGTP pyrophosphatase MutT (NUDIX family)
MTTGGATLEVGVVDVYVLRETQRGWNILALRRGGPGRSPGSWETVHGHIEPGEVPHDAARRELREETGLTTERLYSITVHPFYMQKSATVQMAVVFAAFVDTNRVTLGSEHDKYLWLTPTAASKRFTWPRESEALVHIRRLLRGGNAGAVEDVLRIRNDNS